MAGPVGDRAAWAGLATVLDEGSDEVEVQDGSFDWVRAPQMDGIRCCASKDAPRCQDTVTT